MSLPLFPSPAELLDRHLDDLGPVVGRFRFKQYYLPGSPELELALCLVSPESEEGARCLALVTDQVSEVTRWMATGALDPPGLQCLADAIGSPVVDLFGPWELLPVHIAKPWGQEIWYTGIEARGQSLIAEGGNSVPLPWLLSIVPDRLLQPGGRDPALLKILDPLPEEVFGDLYFELHEEKREVYVVTHVDGDAWPDGTGAIRFGFDPEQRQNHGDADFRARFLSLVRDYEAIRRQIDGFCDRYRRRDGIGLNEPVPAHQLKKWLGDVPRVLRQREEAARAAMNEMTHLVPLAVGDVVKVPCLTPHALQHGVRTVEFQTPVYERKILSFAQKVLTQSHWDTEEAVGLMSLDAGHLEPLPVIERDSGYTLEQVVAFDDFEVFRLTLAVGGTWRAPDRDCYRLAMALQDGALVNGRVLGAEHACLVPRMARWLSVANTGAGSLVVLLCQPIL